MLDSSHERNSDASETNEPLSRETASPLTITVDVESENEAAVSAPVQKKQQRTNKNGQDEPLDEPSPKRRRPNRRENVPQPTLNEPTTNKEQQRPPNRRGRKKMIAKVRTEQDSMVETEQQQPLNEQQQEQQPQQSEKRRQRKSNADVADKEKSGLDAAATTAAVANVATADDQRTIEHVEKMRKRNNRHEYLVTWTTGDNAEWIGRDIMITKYAPHLIAYFERITQFDQLTQQITRKQ